MTNHVRDGLADALGHATRAVLSEADIAFEPTDCAAPDFETTPAFFAAIGFTGDIRGTMILVTTEAVVRAMNAPDVREQITCEAIVRDVLGELANLTLGRLKNRLIPRGVVIALAVPITGSGLRIELSRGSESFSDWLAFTCAAGSFHLRLDADLSRCVAMQTPDASLDSNPMTEGELLLF